MPEKDEGLKLTLQEVDGLMIGKGKPARPMYEVIEPYLEAQLAKATPIIEKQVIREQINFLVDEATKVWSCRIEEAKKQERQKIFVKLSQLALDSGDINLQGYVVGLLQALKEE